MHIMLFGGAFDPSHNGHMLAAQSVIQHHVADELWFVPCFQHPFDKDLSPAQDRLAMLTYIQTPHTAVCDYEIRQHTISYSIDTLRHFSSVQPKDTFSWLIGSDGVSTFHKWKQYEDLLQSFKVFVFPRVGYPLHSSYPEMQLLTDFPMFDDSSTKIREYIKTGKDIGALVTPKVQQYIVEHRLYNTTDEQ